jgi:hypothetical protein
MTNGTKNRRSERKLNPTTSVFGICVCFSDFLPGKSAVISNDTQQKPTSLITWQCSLHNFKDCRWKLKVVKDDLVYRSVEALQIRCQIREQECCLKITRRQFHTLHPAPSLVLESLALSASEDVRLNGVIIKKVYIKKLLSHKHCTHQQTSIK